MIKYIEELLETSNEELNEYAAKEVMGWYWGHFLGSKVWIEGEHPLNVDFVWSDKGVSTGYDSNWNPTGDIDHCTDVVGVMMDDADIYSIYKEGLSAYIRDKIMASHETKRAHTILAIAAVRKLREPKQEEAK